MLITLSKSQFMLWAIRLRLSHQIIELRDVKTCQKIALVFEDRQKILRLDDPYIYIRQYLLNNELLAEDHTICCLLKSMSDLQISFINPQDKIILQKRFFTRIHQSIARDQDCELSKEASIFLLSQNVLLVDTVTMLDFFSDIINVNSYIEAINGWNQIEGHSTGILASFKEHHQYTCQLIEWSRILEPIKNEKYSGGTLIFDIAHLVDDHHSSIYDARKRFKVKLHNR